MMATAATVRKISIVNGVLSTRAGHRYSDGRGRDWNAELDRSCSGPRTIQSSTWVAMKVSIRVETISFTPRLAQRTAAMPANSAPASMPARVATMRASAGGSDGPSRAM